MNLAVILESHARTRPDKVAVQTNIGATTYSELNDRVERVASGLAAGGIAKGDRIVVLMRNGQAYLELLYAAARLGTIIVPVNWRLTPPEISFILDDADPAMIVVHDEFLPLLDEFPAGQERTIVTQTSQDVGIPYEALLSDTPTLPIAEGIGQDDVLVVIYTSGTTGRPKGAMLTHGNLIMSSVNQIVAFEFVASDVALTVAPMFHVGGLLIFTLPVLHLGATVVVHEQFDPGAVLVAFQDHRVTHFFAAPTMFEMVVRHLGDDQFHAPALRVVASGGAALPRSTKERFDELSGLALTEGFGMTETASLSTVVPASLSTAKLGSVGLPAVHVAVRIADAEGNPVAEGSPGELLVRGPNVMAGYWNRPGATADSFWGSWLRTGDVAYMDTEGFVWLVDRVKDLIISGGENIYPREVEQTIEEHADVSEVAIVGASDTLWGEIGVAFVIPRAGATLTEEAIIDHCRGRLAKFKIPKRVVFAQELPRNASGKVLKRSLRELVTAISDD